MSGTEPVMAFAAMRKIVMSETVPRRAARIRLIPRANQVRLENQKGMTTEATTIQISRIQEYAQCCQLSVNTL